MDGRRGGGVISRGSTTVGAVIELPLEPRAAFDAIVEAMVGALARAGLAFDAAADGSVRQDGVEVARVVTWNPGKQIEFAWRPADWEPAVVSTVALSFQAAGGGTRATLLFVGGEQLIGDAHEIAGWFADRVAGPFLAALSPGAMGEWITDRRARRPAGPQARAVYADPLYHYPNFRVILAELALTPDDYLLEVGCGGGAMLKEALESGCRAAAVDHSPEMVRLATEQNRVAVKEGRLILREASADHLPFPDESFTRSAMTGVLGFLSDPVAALAEIRRTLRSGGRLVALGADPELKGTPAAPEPMASRLHFYDDDALERLALDAGFDDVQVIRRNLAPFAREVGVPNEHIALFEGPGPGARFLVAHKR